MSNRFLASIRSALEGGGTESPLIDELILDLTQRSPAAFNQADDVTLVTAEFRRATEHADRCLRLEFSNGKSELVFFPTNGDWRDNTAIEPGNQRILPAAARAS
jgi:hypothetical protein